MAAEVENVKREKLKKAQEAQKAQQENNNQGNQMNNSTNNKNQANLNKKNMHNSLIAELKNKNVGTRKPIRQIPQDEIKDGTFEQIIMDIKSEPYCPRRSIRRNTDRLTSRPFDSLHSNVRFDQQQQQQQQQQEVYTNAADKS